MSAISREDLHGKCHYIWNKILYHFKYNNLINIKGQRKNQEDNERSSSQNRLSIGFCNLKIVSKNLRKTAW